MNIDQSYFDRLAQVESSGNPLAKNPNSSAKGLYQFIDSTAKQYGITAKFGTPEYTKQETAAVKEFTDDNYNFLKKKLGRKPSHGELYLAHQQGAGGAAKMLTNSTKKATDVVGRDAIRLNRGTESMTTGEFANLWVNKFEGKKKKTQTASNEMTQEERIISGELTSGARGGQGSDTLPTQRTINLPDGRAITLTGKESPEQLSALRSKLRERYSTQAPQQPQEPQQAGFFERTGNALLDRGSNIAEAWQQEPNPTFRGISILGQGIGAAGDVLGNLAISGYRSLPDGIQDGVEGAVDAVASAPVGGGSTLGSLASAGAGAIADEYQEFAQENPRTARTLGGIGNIASVAVPIKGFGSAGKAAESSGAAIKSVSQRVKALIPEPVRVTADELAQEAGKYYKIAEDVGGNLRPNATNKMFERVRASFNESGASLPQDTLKAIRKVSDPENVARDVFNVFDSLKGRPLTLEGFKTLDKTLGDVAYAARTPKDVSRKIISMQREMRDLMDNVKPSDIQGGTEGFEAYKRARDLWAKQSKIRDLENITRKAFATDRPAESLKRALKRFTANDKNLRGFTADEISAIKKSAESGAVLEILRMQGSRLSSQIALGSGNPILARGLSAISDRSRGVADDVMLGRMDELSNLIATGQQTQQSTLGRIGRGAISIPERAGGAVQGTFGGAGKQRLTTLGVLHELQRQQEAR